MNSNCPSTIPGLWVLGELPSAVSSACEHSPFPITEVDTCEDFLSKHNHPYSVGCLVTTLNLAKAEIGLDPPNSAIQLAERLKAFECPMCVLVVLTELPTHEARDLYHSEVCDLLTPFMQQGAILDALAAGVEKSQHRYTSTQRNAELRERLAVLTERETDVVKLLCLGKPLKEISAQLGVSVQTASKHRARIYRKLRVANEVELFKHFGAFLESPGSRGEMSRGPNFLERSKTTLEVDAQQS